MSEKHYPYIGGSFDRIIFDGDGSVWVPEPENAKLLELVRKWYPHMLKRVGRDALEQWGQMEVVKELGIEV